MAAGPAWADTEPYWQQKGCEHGHPSKLAYKQIRALVRHTRPSVAKHRVQHYSTCVATRAKAHRAHELARRWWGWRHEYGQLWVIRFNREPAGWRSWAVSTGACESGNRAHTSTGNGFFGAFQWVPSTWYAAGGTGWPSSASWHHEAVMAIGLAQREGTQHWPNCG